MNSEEIRKEIGYQVLFMENNNFPNDFNSVEILDTLLWNIENDSIISNILNLYENNKESKKNLPKDEAKNVLNRVINTLNILGFETSFEDIGALYNQGLKARKFDCDLWAYTFITIAERLNLPIYCSLMPEHVCLIWDNGDYCFFWDPTCPYNDKEISREEFIKNKNIPDISIKNNIYLSKIPSEKLIGICYSSIGIKYANKEQYENAIKYYDLSLQYLSMPETYRNKGLSYDKTSNFKKALIEFNHSIDINPNYADAYASRGNTYRKLKLFDEAQKDLEYCLKLDSLNKSAYHYLGLVYSDNDLPDTAILYYKKVIEIDPEYMEAYYNLGTNYGIIGNFALSIQYLNKAIELNPDYEEAYYNRAKAYSSINQNLMAIQDYKKAVMLNPKDKEAFVNLGNLFLNPTDAETAISYFNKAIEIDSNYSNAYAAKGGAYFYLKNYDSALMCFNTAIEIDSNNIEAYSNRGTYYLMHGQMISSYQEIILSLNDLNIVLDKAPDSPLALVNRGVVKFLLGDKEGACIDWKKAKKLGFIEVESYIQNNCF